MRATYQLNTEKLEYNFSVLTERDAENSHTIAQHKRKLARLTVGGGGGGGQITFPLEYAILIILTKTPPAIPPFPLSFLFQT